MHELPYNPPDYGLSRGTPLFPFRPTEKHRSHSLQRKPFICELAGSGVWLRSLRRTVRAIVALRHLCVRSLFPRSSSLACVHRPCRNQLPSETTIYVAAVTPLLDNERGEHEAIERRALPGGRLPCLWSGSAHVTDIRFAFEALQHDHDAKTFGFATEGSSLTRQEFAECDSDVLMPYGRCLRPALY